MRDTGDANFRPGDLSRRGVSGADDSSITCTEDDEVCFGFSRALLVDLQAITGRVAVLVQVSGMSDHCLVVLSRHLTSITNHVLPTLSHYCWCHLSDYDSDHSTCYSTYYSCDIIILHRVRDCPPSALGNHQVQGLIDMICCLSFVAPNKCP